MPTPIFPKAMSEWMGQALMIVVVIVLVIVVAAEEFGVGGDAVSPFGSKGVWIVIIGLLLCRGLAELNHQEDKWSG